MRQFKPGQLQTGSLYPITASFALTASYLSGSISIDTGSLVTTASFNAFTSSYTTGSFTGSFKGDGSQLTGIVSSKWTGSNPISRESDVEITGSLRIQGSITGSLFGTASWATNAVTASYVQTAQTASYILNAVSSSFSQTASFVTTAQTASYVLQAVSASFATSSSRAVSSSFASTASFVQTAQTASYILTAVSSSFASTASFVQTAQTASYVLNAVSASFATSASQAISASFAATASYVLNAITASHALESNTILPLGGNNLSGLISYVISTGSMQYVKAHHTLNIDIPIGGATSTVYLTGSLIASSITGSLQGTASYVAAGGSNTMVQFNESGSFSAISGVTINKNARSFQNGNNAIASGQYSHAQGINTIASGEYSHAEGISSVTGYPAYSSSITSGVVEIDASLGDLTGTFSDGVVIYYAIASNPGENITPGIVTGSLWNGTNTIFQLLNDPATTIAPAGILDPSGNLPILIGGYGAHVEGQSSVAIGASSHAEGFSTTYGAYSHAEGNANTYAEYSHAEGAGATYGIASHAEGAGVTFADYTHAEGNGTAGQLAYQTNNIAAGVIEFPSYYGNLTGVFSPGALIYVNDTAQSVVLIHEVSSSLLSGSGETKVTLVDSTYDPQTSYFVGLVGNSQPTYADVRIGEYSHAEGYGTTTLGVASHAEGLGTTTHGFYQTVVGQYNAPVQVSSSFVIGNGVDSLTPSNLLVAYGDTVQITGSLTVSGSSTFRNIGLAVFTGSVIAQAVTGSFTGSFVGAMQGTASFAATASYVLQAVSASFATSASRSVSSSFSQTASFATTATSASFAPSTPTFPHTGSALITGSLGITGSLTATQIGIGATANGSTRLDVRAQSALSTDIAFRVRNSADTFNLLTQQGDGLLLIGSGSADADDILIRAKQGAANYLKLSNQGGIAIGSGSNIPAAGSNNTAIAIGNLSSARAYFTNGGGVAIGQSTYADANSVAIGTLAKAGLTAGGTNTSISIGYNAQTNSSGGDRGIAIGSNSSGGTSNSDIISIGTSVTQGSFSSGRNTFIGQYITGTISQTDMIVLGGGTGTGASAAQPTIIESFSVYLGNTQRSFFVNKNSNVVLRSLSALTAGTHYSTNATNTLTIHSGSAPTTNISSSFQLYASGSAANASANFRNANGSIIKLYKEIQPALSGSANTGNAETDALINAMKTIILNLGLGASS